jgi:uncharacterized OB-fold protein
LEETPAKPVPVPDALSAGYWEAANRGVLALPRCSVCSQLTLPAGALCPRCGSTDPAWTTEPVDGTATVRSWTVVRDSFLPGFAGDVPYVIVDVELDVQPDLRLLGRLTDGPDAPLHVGDPVTVAFDRLDEEFAVPAFTLVAADRRGGA